MISYPNLQQYTQGYQNNYNQYQNNYNQVNYNQSMQQNYNNYSTNIFPQQNYQNNTNINNTNIFNNLGGYQMIQQPMVMQQPMMIQQQPMMIQQPMVMQQPMMIQQQPMMIQQQPMMIQQQQMIMPQQQQSDSSGFMQQLIMMLLPMLLGSNEPVVEDEVIEETEVTSSVWGDPHYTGTGADGKTAINFTHNGTTGDTYNVFEGDGYRIEGKYGSNGGINYITDTKIKAGADTIEHNAKGETRINGKIIKDGKTVKLNDGTKVIVKGSTMTLETKDGNSKVDILSPDNGVSLTVNPDGDFSGLNGIMGTAINENRNLSEEEANKFDITTKNKTEKK